MKSVDRVIPAALTLKTDRIPPAASFSPILSATEK
jgi:hypothetical protein